MELHCIELLRLAGPKRIRKHAVGPQLGLLQSKSAGYSACVSHCVRSPPAFHDSFMTPYVPSSNTYCNETPERSQHADSGPGAPATSSMLACRQQRHCKGAGICGELEVTISYLPTHSTSQWTCRLAVGSPPTKKITPRSESDSLMTKAEVESR